MTRRAQKSELVQTIDITARDGVVAGSVTNVAPPLFAENQIHIEAGSFLPKWFKKILFKDWNLVACAME
jgi:hypothetical protein